jgi:aspartate carbamoyltransferase catalytic subunit
MRHLLSIEDLDRATIERILDRAKSFTEVSEREIKKVPALRGRRVLNLFWEASTRTRSSFELAAKALSADVVNLSSSGSAIEKGESLKDTVYALRDRIGEIEGANIWIVGDVLHSRVARSCIHAFNMLGAKVTVCGPPTLIPRDMESLGCEVQFTLDRLPEADVVYALRMQNERMTDSFVPSLREYAMRYQVDGRRLSSRQVLMHPGPVNRGVELAAEVIDSPQAIIGQQVAAGVVVRMAVLYELLAGRGAPATQPEVATPVTA